jgi:hypothetical protein
LVVQLFRPANALLETLHESNAVAQKRRFERRDARNGTRLTNLPG